MNRRLRTEIQRRAWYAAAFSFRAGVPTNSVSGTCGVRKYPSPPLDLAISPDVQTMHDRYMNYLQGREPLSSMAFFCLTVLENSAGGRKAAARKYQIAKRVLEKNRLSVLREKEEPEAEKRRKELPKN